MLQSHVPAWFEIPTADLERACRFYGHVVGATLTVQKMGPMAMAVFPGAEGQPTGAIMEPMPGCKPGLDGTVVYLNLDDAGAALARAKAAGAEVLVPLTTLPEGIGVFAQIRDSEGNRVGLFSRA